MPVFNARTAFVILHATLGSALVIMGHNALFHAMHEHGDPHMMLTAALEMIGALLLLIPRTLRIGGFALLLVFVPGFLFRLMHGEWDLHLLIYAAGVWFIMANGPAWGAGPRINGTHAPV
jgi:hypothetical protein